MLVFSVSLPADSQAAEWLSRLWSECARAVCWVCGAVLHKLRNATACSAFSAAVLFTLCDTWDGELHICTAYTQTTTHTLHQIEHFVNSSLCKHSDELTYVHLQHSDVCVQPDSITHMMRLQTSVCPRAHTQTRSASAHFSRPSIAEHSLVALGAVS